MSRSMSRISALGVSSGMPSASPSERASITSVLSHAEFSSGFDSMFARKVASEMSEYLLFKARYLSVKQTCPAAARGFFLLESFDWPKDIGSY